MSDQATGTAASRMQVLRRSFEKTYGHQPDGIWRAPGRVNLIGEHTDYNMGFVLPFAIDKNALVAVRRKRTGQAAAGVLDFASTFDAQDPPPVTSVPLTGLAPGTVPGWAAYPAAVAWALGRLPQSVPAGFQLLVDSDVPAGSGLSSSHAIEVATIVALNDLYALGLGRKDMALLTQHAENEFVGAPTGIMDQSASLMSRAGHALLLDCRSLDSQPVPLPLSEWDMAVLVIDTKVAHSHIDGGYGARRKSCEQACTDLGVGSLREVTDLADLRGLDPLTRRRARHVVSENQRVHDAVRALRSGNLEALGRLLCASHESMRDDYGISCPELDLAVEAAIGAGAVGARMTGGGFGGSAIALVTRDRIPVVSDAVRAAFDGSGFTPPGIFTVIPDVGAGKA